MPRIFPLRKSKQRSIPLPDPMTSVIQEINGLKRTVTSTTKKPKMSATHQSEKVTSTKEIFSETEDAGPTHILNEAKIAMEALEIPSSFNRTTAKPKQLALDPLELQSISKLQNWSPSIRNPAENSQTENRISKKFTSQKERLDESKSNPQVIKLTQYKPVVWNPPFRKNSSATETSETPAKRAKILDANVPSHLPEDKFKEKVVSPMLEQSVSQNASTLDKLENHEVKIQDDPQMIGFYEKLDRSQKSTGHFEAKISSNEELENYGNISYSPINTASNRQVFRDALEDNLEENLQVEFSQNSEVYMFLSQEPTEEDLCGKFHVADPLEDVLATKVCIVKNIDRSTNESKFLEYTKNKPTPSVVTTFGIEFQVEDPFGENLESEAAMEIEKPNTNESNKIQHSQEFSDKDIFETEYQDEDPFDINCSWEKPKLDSASQCETSDGGITVKKVVEDKEITGEEVFHSLEENLPSIVSQRPQCGSQRLEPGLILAPGINEICINSAPHADLMITPPNQIELDISSWQTVKRTYSKIPDAVPTGQFVPDVTDFLDVKNIPKKKIQSPHLNNVENLNDYMQSPKVSISTSVDDIALVDEAPEVTNGILEKKVGTKVDSDFNVGNCEFQDSKHENSDKLADFLSEKGFDVSKKQCELKNIFNERAVQDDESSKDTFHHAEDKKIDVEELLLDESTNLIKCGNKIDANASAETSIDLSKKVEISKTTALKEQENHDSISQNDVSKEHDLETRNPRVFAENEIPQEAEGNCKVTENEKVLPVDGVRSLSQKTLQIEEKEEIIQGADTEMKKPITIEKVHSMEVDLPNSSASNDNSKAHTNEDKGKMKPYTYEIDQDFDISQSQLIEIERAIMRENRGSGLAASFSPADGVVREAATFPGIVMGACGEARMPGFSMPRVPPLPPLNWKKKAQEDRQKLRAAIHEISRLNAMLMSVRREVWPPNPETSASSDTNRQATGPGARRY